MELIDFFKVFLIFMIADLGVELMRNKWSKKCNYDCSKCKVWGCRRHICLQKLNKNKEK